jgi:hypothetical protein
MNGKMKGLSVESVARDGNCLFRKFNPLVECEAIKNNVSLHEGRLQNGHRKKMKCVVVISKQ